MQVHVCRYMYAGACTLSKMASLTASFVAYCSISSIGARLAAAMALRAPSRLTEDAERGLWWRGGESCTEYSTRKSPLIRVSVRVRMEELRLEWRN